MEEKYCRDIKFTMLNKVVLEDINESVLRLFFIKNKDIFQAELYKNNSIGTWNCINDIGEKKVIINLIYFDDIKIDDQYLKKIISNVISNSVLASYEEYVEFRKKGSINIMKNVLAKIAPESCNDEELNYDEYYNQIKFIDEVLLDKFSIESTNYQKMSQLQYDDCLDNIPQGELCFMGIYFYGDNDSFSTGEEYILLKIIEKYIGDNDTDSMYFKYRESGKIYTAITSYVNNMRLFVTGVIGNYDEEFFDLITEKLKGLTINKMNLDMAKERVINEIKRLILECGELYTMYPYRRRFDKEILKEDLYRYIRNVDISLVNNYLTTISPKKVKAKV